MAELVLNSLSDIPPSGGVNLILHCAPDPNALEKW